MFLILKLYFHAPLLPYEGAGEVSFGKLLCCLWAVQLFWMTSKCERT